ncbi:MAG: hypothetical protein AAF328_11665 [Planctomycetota bacterium]
MRGIPKRFCLFVCLTVAASAVGQSALQHVDALPYALDGKIAVGKYDFDGGGIIAEAQVFAEPLESIQPSFHGVNAPGFFSLPDSPLLPNADLSFSVPAVTDPVSPDQPRNALYWSGSGDVSFGDLPDGHDIQIRLSRFVTTQADGGSADVSGYVLNTTGPTGTIHEHVGFRARGDGVAPDDGVYLLPFQLHQPGLESSDVLYFVFNGKYERDEQDEIIFDGFLPRVDEDAQIAAVTYLEALLAGAGQGVLGDYNDSGSVEQGDLNLVLNNWGGARGDWANADGFASTNVDQEELNRVLNNWGATAPPDFAGVAVPEPALAAAVLGFGAVSLRRRR